MLRERYLLIIVEGGAVHFVGLDPNIEEATEDAFCRAVDFAVARTGLTCC
jgi:hypothetical protein